VEISISFQEEEMRSLISQSRAWTLFTAVAILGVLAVVIIKVNEAPVYGQFTPAYDITGVWTGKDPGPHPWYQNGTEVKGIYVNRMCGHYMTGKYVNPTTIVVTVYRRTRSNGCLTVLTDTITVNSADSLSDKFVAQDSNCDLTAGWTGTGTLSRDQKLSDAWY
jgi:hypothetical protein